MLLAHGSLTVHKISLHGLRTSSLCHLAAACMPLYWCKCCLRLHGFDEDTLNSWTEFMAFAAHTVWGTVQAALHAVQAGVPLRTDSGTVE